jgi:hypothetical protein
MCEKNGLAGREKAIRKLNRKIECQFKAIKERTKESRAFTENFFRDNPEAKIWGQSILKQSEAKRWAV